MFVSSIIGRKMLKIFQKVYTLTGEPHAMHMVLEYPHLKTGRGLM